MTDGSRLQSDIIFPLSPGKYLKQRNNKGNEDPNICRFGQFSANQEFVNWSLSQLNRRRSVLFLIVSVPNPLLEILLHISPIKMEKIDIDINTNQSIGRTWLRRGATRSGRTMSLTRSHLMICGLNRKSLLRRLARSRRPAVVCKRRPAQRSLTTMS